MSLGWILPFLKEFLLATVAKMAFKTVFERMVTRQVVRGLYWLADNSHNLLTAEDVDIMTEKLRDKGLKKAGKRKFGKIIE